MLKRLVIILAILVIPGAASAAAGYFQISNNVLYFPDGSFLTKAPLDGKSILNGSGSPGSTVANPGDFYIDTANHLLYGPYNGSWGTTGVSLVGQQGPKGDPGASPFTLNGTNAVYTGGSVGIGTTSPAAAAALDVSSTSKGFLPPRMTTAQRNAIPKSPLAEGLMIYNTDTKTLDFYNGTVWNTVAILQQDLLGQTAGTSSFNTGPYYFTGYLAPHSGTISSVDIRVNGTGTFRLLIMNAARVTQRSSSDVAVNTTGLVTVLLPSSISIIAGEYIGFYYTGATTFTSGTGTTYYGSSETPASYPNSQMSISAAVTY
jgi:hypothetical protein